MKRYVFIPCTGIEDLQVSHSKRRKHLEEIRQYWKEKAEVYYERMDEDAETDSQDSLDHGVWPTDTATATYQKKSS